METTGTTSEFANDRAQDVLAVQSVVLRSGLAEVTVITGDHEESTADFNPHALFHQKEPVEALASATGLTFTPEQADGVLRKLASLVPWTERARPSLVLGGQQLREESDQVCRVLELANSPLENFVRGGALTQIRRDEGGHQFPESMTFDALRHRLSRVADWFGLDGSPIPPPQNLLRDVAVRGDWDLPPLVGVARTPVLRPDGSVLTETGYDPATRLIYDPTENLHVDVPDRPTDEQVRVALELLQEVFCDFPFVDQASRANALALMLTPVLRPVIDGPTPMALIDAPTIGTGKTLIATVASLVTTGTEPPLFGAPKDSEEFRKQITSYLNVDTPFVVLDNLSGPLKSGELAKALTADVWADRILRKSLVVKLPVRCTWVATGNNIRVSGEIARRCYLIRINRDVARPHEHTDFLHPRLKEWVRENRSRLLSALLTLARAWFVAGKPKANVEPMGTFESWSQTVGGVLACVGLEGFLGNRQELLKELAEDTAEWDAFLEEWFAALGDRLVTTAELVTNPDLMEHLPTELALERGRNSFTFNTVLGTALRDKKDHVTPKGLALRKPATGHANKAKWQVTSLTEARDG